MRFALIFIILFICSNLWTQNIPFRAKFFKQDKEGFQAANKALQNGNLLLKEGKYFMALKSYFIAQDFNPNNAMLNYNIGYCLYKSIGRSIFSDASSAPTIANELNALKFLKKADTLDPMLNSLILSSMTFQTDNTNDINYLIGRCLHLNMDYEDAIAEYEQAIENLDLYEELLIGISKAKAKREIQNEIKSCGYGIKTKDNIQSVIISNLGPNINSVYPEYAPLIDLDEMNLYYTSRRPKNNQVDSLSEAEYMEDIFNSKKDNLLNWQESQPLNDAINTSAHDATVGLSFDGQTLFLYKSDDNNSGDLYTSTLIGDLWSKPIALNTNINSRYQETSACFSPDERTLYFVSNRPNGLGGRDIYYCNKMRDGRWSRAMSIGQGINTRFDEDGVFMHPDGKTLFFSSKGHESIGGFDIFKSTLKDGQWTKPINLGYPINTPGDDVCFILSADGKRAYLSSFRRGSLGDKDIFMVEFPANYWSLDETDHNDLVLLKGIVLDQVSNRPLEAEVIIIDNIADSVLAEFKSNAKTGKYLVALPSGKNYGIVIQKEDMLFHSENINIPKGQYREVQKDVKLQKIKTGSRLVLRNIFFESGTTNLQEESKSELKRLVKFLIRFKKLRFEIAGHTDNTGIEQKNIMLSEQRAKAIYNYLVENNISPERLSYKGYGAKKPVADNNTEEGRRQNRRTEFLILK